MMAAGYGNEQSVTLLPRSTPMQRSQRTWFEPVDFARLRART
jgi:hypothetical protein